MAVIRIEKELTLRLPEGIGYTAGIEDDRGLWFQTIAAESIADYSEHGYLP